MQHERRWVGGFALALALVLVIPLMGQQGPPPPAVPAQASEPPSANSGPFQDREHLRTAILQALIKDPELGQFPLAASVSPDQTVVLQGAVPNKRDQEQAARLVKAIPGVKKVQNEIAVDAATAPLPSGPGIAAATPAGPAKNATTADGQPTVPDIQTTIQNALGADPALAGVKVAVGGEQVTLTGNVPDQKAKDRASKVAAKAAAQLKVVNELQVEK